MQHHLELLCELLYGLQQVWLVPLWGCLTLTTFVACLNNHVCICLCLVIIHTCHPL